MFKKINTLWLLLLNAGIQNAASPLTMNYGRDKPGFATVKAPSVHKPRTTDSDAASTFARSHTSSVDADDSDWAILEDNSAGIQNAASRLTPDSLKELDFQGFTVVEEATWYKPSNADSDTASTLAPSDASSMDTDDIDWDTVEEDRAFTEGPEEAWLIPGEGVLNCYTPATVDIDTEVEPRPDESELLDGQYLLPNQDALIEFDEKWCKYHDLILFSQEVLALVAMKRVQEWASALPQSRRSIITGRVVRAVNALEAFVHEDPRHLADCLMDKCKHLARQRPSYRYLRNRHSHLRNTLRRPYQNMRR